MLLISDCKLKRLPQCVWNISLTIAVKTPGIKNNPTSAARDATFHLTQAEIVCVSRASRRIQTRLPRKTALAMGMLSQNHDQPSRYLWSKNKIKPVNQLIVESITT